VGQTVNIGNKLVGDGQPVFIAAEIGINHNGDVDITKRLIDAALKAGCGAVKFQKRTPEMCVPRDQWAVEWETPWGIMTYIDYRRRLELGLEAYREINKYCMKKEITWFASCWDEESVEFIAQFSPPCYKVASACLTNDSLLHTIRKYDKPLILSTGMSAIEQVDHAVEVLGLRDLIILHCTSTYPAKIEELNLQVIQSYRKRYDCPIGYSGHEVGLQATLATIVLGACYVEQHVTLDRAMWGTDQAASVEPYGFDALFGISES